jgi:Tfp pilus assembly protein PilF
LSAAVARRYFVRGREHLRRGELDDAQREFTAAVELDNGYAEARIGLALTLVRVDPPRAQSTLRTGLNRATRPAERQALLCALADAQLVGGDFLGAEDSYNEALKLPGTPPKIHDRLARLRAKTGRISDALDELRQAVAKK